MRRATMCAVALVACLCLPHGTWADSYHSAGTLIPIAQDSSRVIVRFDWALPPQSQSELLASLTRSPSMYSDPDCPPDFIACSLSVSSGYSQYVDSLRNVSGIVMAEPYYVSFVGQAMLAGTEIGVKFGDNVSQTQIDSICALLGAHVSDSAGDNIFLLEKNDTLGTSVVQLSNTFFDLPETEYAYPNFGNFIFQNSHQLYDYYRNYQPYTKEVIGTFNEATAWDFSGTARTVVIGLLDDGLTQHEDIDSSRILPGYDWAGNSLDKQPDSNPQPGRRAAHGMAHAGIIGANHSTNSSGQLDPNSGVISINPHVKFLPLKVYFDDGWRSRGPYWTQMAIRQAWRSGADVIANSWLAVSPNDGVTGELIDAYLHGRSDKGCAIVFPSGNFSSSYPGSVLYPAYLDEVLAVGVVDSLDQRWSFSNYGSTLDVVAPGGDVNNQGDVWSLDQMDTLGVNFQVSQLSAAPADTVADVNDCPPASDDLDYQCKFGGTSSAEPIVAGIAALLISKDSTLRANKIYDIIRYSAVTKLRSDTIYPPNNERGYGRADAFRALLSISAGNIDNDSTGNVDIADLTALIDRLFITLSPLFPSSMIGDVDCSGNVDIGDVTALIDNLFGNFTPLKRTPQSPCYKF